MAVADQKLRDRPGAWVDLGLTLPIFLIYQLAVPFLNVQNGTDVVTGNLLALSHGDRTTYLIATIAIGVIFAGGFALAGRGRAFHPRKFVQIAVEGVVYAFLMWFVASRLVGVMFAGPSAIAEQGKFTGFIMSLGAGFYEELAFRVVLFGLGAKVLVMFLGRKQTMVLTGTAPVTRYGFRSLLIMVLWAFACAVIFSSVHYVGALSDKFMLSSFLFRTVLGLVLTAIFVTRGFAAAVWAHAIYDVWVLVL